MGDHDGHLTDRPHAPPARGNNLIVHRRTCGRSRLGREDVECARFFGNGKPGAFCWSSHLGTAALRPAYAPSSHSQGRSGGGHHGVPPPRQPLWNEPHHPPLDVMGRSAAVPKCLCRRRETHATRPVLLTPARASVRRHGGPAHHRRGVRPLHPHPRCRDPEPRHLGRADGRNRLHRHPNGGGGGVFRHGGHCRRLFGGGAVGASGPRYPQRRLREVAQVFHARFSPDRLELHHDAHGERHHQYPVRVHELRADGAAGAHHLRDRHRVGLQPRRVWRYGPACRHHRHPVAGAAHHAPGVAHLPQAAEAARPLLHGLLGKRHGRARGSRLQQAGVRRPPSRPTASLPISTASRFSA